MKTKEQKAVEFSETYLAITYEYIREDLVNAYIAGYEEANRWIPIEEFDSNRQGWHQFKDEDGPAYNVGKYSNGVIWIPDGIDYDGDFVGLSTFTHFRYIE